MPKSVVFSMLIPDYTMYSGVCQMKTTDNRYMAKGVPFAIITINYTSEYGMKFENLGKLHDLIYLLELWFHPQKKKNLQKMWFDFEKIPPELNLFFYCTEENKVLMKHLYNQYLSKTSEYEVADFLKALSDHVELTKQVIHFYFPNNTKELQTQTSEALVQFGERIKNSNYPAELKNSLYAFFIDPFLTTQNLIYSMMFMKDQVSCLYESKSSRLVNLQMNFSGEILNRVLKIAHVEHSEPESIVVNFCLADENCLDISRIGKDIILMLGTNYLSIIKEKQHHYELYKFGEALEEPNRVKILGIILKRGSISAQELRKQLSLSGTNIYYHLTLMVKNNMLLTEASGRTLYYRLNRDYFTEIQNDLQRFCN